MHEQVARGALIIGAFLFVVSGFMLCFCPEFYVLIALCGITATWLGERIRVPAMSSFAGIEGLT